jgi:hypothetical protein
MLDPFSVEIAIAIFEPRCFKSFRARGEIRHGLRASRTNVAAKQQQ